MSENQVVKVEKSSAELWREMDIANPSDAAGIFAQSRYFKDAQGTAQALVKVMAGRELGIGSFAAMSNIDIVKGHLRMRSNLLAGLVKRSDKYDYRVREWSDQGCKIEFFETINGERESIGFGEFCEADRQRAGLSLKTEKGYDSVWAKYPRAMFLARAISNGVAAHCPDVTGGTRIFTEADSFGPARPAPTTTMQDLDADLGIEPPKQIEEPAEGETVVEPEPMSEVAREFFKDTDEDGF